VLSSCSSILSNSQSIPSSSLSSSHKFLFVSSTSLFPHSFLSSQFSYASSSFTILLSSFRKHDFYHSLLITILYFPLHIFHTISHFISSSTTTFFLVTELLESSLTMQPLWRVRNPICKKSPNSCTTTIMTGQHTCKNLSPFLFWKIGD
jgi:hypothetical protein